MKFVRATATPTRMPSREDERENERKENKRTRIGTNEAGHHLFWEPSTSGRGMETSKATTTTTGAGDALSSAHNPESINQHVSPKY